MPICRPGVPARQRQLAHPLQRPGSCLPIANLAIDGQRLVESRRGTAMVAALTSDRGQEVERMRHARLVVEFPREAEAFLPTLLSLEIIASMQCELTQTNHHVGDSPAIPLLPEQTQTVEQVTQSVLGLAAAAGDEAADAERKRHAPLVSQSVEVLE